VEALTGSLTRERSLEEAGQALLRANAGERLQAVERAASTVADQERRAW
jgi:hypothetical protein